MPGIGDIYGNNGNSSGGIVQFGSGEIEYDVNGKISAFKNIPETIGEGQIDESFREAAESEMQAASARIWSKNALRVVNARVDLYRTHANFQAGISRAEMRAGGIQLGHARVLWEKNLVHRGHSTEYNVWQSAMGSANNSIDY